MINLSLFGVSLVVGLFFGLFVVWHQGKEEHFDEESLLDGVIWGVFWGLLGARAWYVGWHFNEFGLDPVKILAFTAHAGLGWWGGLIGGTLALWGFSRQKKWDFWEAADVMVMGLSLAQVFGWLGALAVGFNQGRGGKPVQLLASGLLLGLFVLLTKIFQHYRTYEWYQGKKGQAQTGLVTMIYLGAWGVIDWLIAWLRPIKVMWWLDLILILAAGAGVYWRSARSLSGDTENIVKWIKERLQKVRRK